MPDTEPVKTRAMPRGTGILLGLAGAVKAEDVERKQERRAKREAKEWVED